mgnify:CR=1 FL=1
MRENNSTILDGRGYSINDDKIIMSLGVGSGLISILVLMLYTSSEKVQEIYATPLFLIALAPILLYWVSRLWLLASKGEIKADPVLFTLKDKNSYLVAICFIAIMLISKYAVF